MEKYNLGEYADRSCYLSYQPSVMNQQWVIKDVEIYRLLEEASQEISRLKTYVEENNGGRFLSVFVAREAVYSLRLSNFDVDISSFVNHKAQAGQNPNEELYHEVDKYIQTMVNASKLLSSLPFSARLIREVHRLLMDDSLSHDLQPGEFRTNQTWIGSSLQTAEYIPPVPSSIVELMSDLEMFINDDEKPILLRAAMMHYQFEAVHPFLDGNARLGRLLIPLYLKEKGMLSSPMFLLSEYLYENKKEYVKAQQIARAEQSIDVWLKFFLRSVIEASRYTVTVIRKCVQDADVESRKIAKLGIREKGARLVIEFLQNNWVIFPNDVERLIKKSNVTAYKLLSDLEQMRVINEVSGHMRNRVFVLNSFNNKCLPTRKLML